MYIEKKMDVQTFIGDGFFGKYPEDSSVKSPLR
jgi:hypothetical protein